MKVRRCWSKDSRIASTTRIRKCEFYTTRNDVTAINLNVIFLHIKSKSTGSKRSSGVQTCLRDRLLMEALMASSDLPDVPPGTELDTYAAEVDLSQPQLQMTPDGMITEPVLGIRMLMSSRVS